MDAAFQREQTRDPVIPHDLPGRLQRGTRPGDPDLRAICHAQFQKQFGYSGIISCVDTEHRTVAEFQQTHHMPDPLRQVGRVSIQEGELPQQARDERLYAVHRKRKPAGGVRLLGDGQ
jgi:hypothetical protein